MNMFRRVRLPPTPGFTADGLPALVPALISVMKEKDALQLAHRVSRAARNGGTLVQLIGAQGHEGTSTLARDFVLTMAARSERPVLLLDLDVPINGQLQWFHRAGVPMEPGRLLTLAEGGDALRLHALPGTSLLVSEQILAQGQAGLHPELLARSGVLKRLREEFALVVVDSPPLARSFDGVGLSADLDATAVVLRAERTRAAVARDLCDRLTEAGAELVGFVFNRRRRLVPSFLYRRLG